jgi:hypothetical protein
MIARVEYVITVTVTPIVYMYPDGYKAEEPEPSGREQVDSLCELAVIFGMPVEKAEAATPTELRAYLEPYTKLDCADCRS